jgi:hypothetical protein
MGWHVWVSWVGENENGASSDEAEDKMRMLVEHVRPLEMQVVCARLCLEFERICAQKRMKTAMQSWPIRYDLGPVLSHGECAMKDDEEGLCGWATSLPCMILPNGYHHQEHPSLHL